MGLIAITIPNQWQSTFTQSVTFGTTPPALQSVPVALTVANSVGGGSGTPSAGNWLFCIVGMSEQSAAAGFTVGVGDDIRSLWRPGNETTSTWAVSTASALTRTAVWYTANTARAAGYVYVAPDGAFDALTVLVVEVAGLGPWDTVAGIATNYAAAATSLSLSLGAPSAQALIIGAVAGDSTTATQAFAPASWTALHTVTATNGTDHTTDSDLTSAYIVTSGSVSVTGTAVSATDLSGVLISVLTSASSPIPAAQNPAWPYMRFEAAFGGGFQTPPDQLTWTDLSSRLWSWNETTGAQYQLGQIQATQLDLEIDNGDGALTPFAPSSAWSFTASGTPLTANYFIVTTAQAASITAGNGFTDTKNPGTFFTVTNVGAPFAGFNNITFTPSAAAIMSNPDVVTQAAFTTGTPVRLRAALGTLGGVTFNRWYAIQRNAEEWPQEIDPAYRRMLNLTGTDIWSVLSSSGPSPYRGEVQQDSPYAWWPADDQPLAGGVQPTSLRNAALGNTNTLSIVVSPHGTGPTNWYGTDGFTQSNVPYAVNVNEGVATSAVGQNQGFLYGDPQASPASYQTSNPVTSNPGSAAWQTTGQAGNTGADGWFLSCNDASFPPLASGVTVEGWYSYPYFGTTTFVSASGTHVVAQQPDCPLSLLTLTTNSAPVAILQIDTSGHLSLVTYSGTTPTSNSIYTTTDLRDGAWHHYAVTLTTTAWTVYVDGGLAAKVSGTAAGMTSAWTYLIANGDMGNTSGGGTTANIVHSGNVSVSHIAVYPQITPNWRVLARYCAAITGFGGLPAPQNVATTLTSTVSTAVAPDGQFATGTYGSGLIPAPFSVSTVVVAQAGSYTSGPSAASVTGSAQSSSTSRGYSSYNSWTGVAPRFAVYNAASVGAETQASVVAGNSEDYSSGYGSGASGYGIGHVSGGSGASPPAAASSLGDTVAQRIERILGYVNATYPGRCADPAALAVQAATDIGGQQAGQNLQNIAQSDGGLLYVDNLGNLTYWQRTHLAAQYSSPAWTLSPTAPPTPGAPASAVPYYREGFRWTGDPQRVWNAVQVTPFSPDGASLAVIEPSNATGVNASQKQYGAQPRAFTSYLQSATEMQSQASWLFSNYGTLQVRVEDVKVDAAPYPAAFGLVMGVSVGDVVTCENWQAGGGGTVGTFRVSQVKRVITFGGGDREDATRAEVTLMLDFEPSSYWS